MSVSEITLRNGNIVQAPQVEGFTVTAEGVYEGYSAQETRLCDLIVVETNIRDINTKRTMARLSFLDSATGEMESFDCSRSQLIPAGGTVLIGALVDQGFNIEPGKQQVILKYLMSQTNVGIQLATNKIGWYGKQGKKGFVLPNKTYAPADGLALFVPESPAPVHSNIKASCTLEEEKQHVDDVLRGNPYLIFVRGIGLAAPFLSALDVEGGGFHLFTQTSRGKTTQAQLAAAVWGKGADPQVDSNGTIIQRWNTTANALEGTAQSFSDLLLVMDEIGTNNTANFGSAIYNLMGGQGKAAMTANRGMREVRTWTAFILRTGEYSIADHTADSTGSVVAAGQKVRMLDIPIPDDVFIETGELSPSKFADKVKHVSSTYYGASGEAIVEKLVDVVNEPEELSVMQRNYQAIYDDLVGDIEPPEQQRAIKRFALVGVALQKAIEWGITDIDPEEAHEAVEIVLKSWLDTTSMLSDVDVAINNIAKKLRTEPGLFADSRDPNRRAGGRLVGYYDQRNRRHLILKSELSGLFGNRANEKHVLRKLQDMGCLHQNNVDRGVPRLSSKYKVASVGKIAAYGIEASFLENYGDESEVVELEDAMVVDSAANDSDSFCSTDEVQAG